MNAAMKWYRGKSPPVNIDVAMTHCLEPVEHQTFSYSWLKAVVQSSSNMSLKGKTVKLKSSNPAHATLASLPMTESCASSCLQ